VTEVEVKTILNRKKIRDTWFLDDYTINPYLACSFNCLFCYIRGSKYGTHMEKKLQVKKNALALLAKQLRARAKKNQQGIIVLSSATEPYLQAEEKLELTRQMLELIYHYRFAVHVLTRSSLVTRDLDLLRKINEAAILPRDLQKKGLPGAFVTFSFSTDDDAIAKIFEPGATPPSERLKTMQAVHHAGFLTGVSLMPLLPHISDSFEQLNAMLPRLKAHGARYIMPAGLTLFGEGPADSKTLVFKAIDQHFPRLAAKYRELFMENQPASHPYYVQMQRTVSALLKKHGIRDRILETA
jgi:DNA repair photolyase